MLKYPQIQESKLGIYHHEEGIIVVDDARQRIAGMAGVNIIGTMAYDPRTKGLIPSVRMEAPAFGIVTLGGTVDRARATMLSVFNHLATQAFEQQDVSQLVVINPQPEWGHGYGDKHMAGHMLKTFAWRYTPRTLIGFQVRQG